MPSFSYQNLLDDSKRDAGSITNIRRIANRSVLFVVGDLDLRSTKRRAYLAPGLNSEQFDHQAPSDLKEWAIIDVARVEGRLEEDKFNLVTNEYFDRNKENNDNLVAVQDRDFLKKLRISADVGGDDNEATLHTCESLTSNGTWQVSGNASNLTLDSDIYAQGDASLNFDLAASWTSASVVVGAVSTSLMTAVDISDYELGGSVFVNVWIPSTTGLTSINVKVGSGSTNYFRQSVTVTNENLVFSTGWNLLRIDFASATETGTVDMDNIDYLEVGIVGDGTASASTDWRLDYFIARRGIQHEGWYYTKFGWQTSGGSYIEESTVVGDKINADTEEYYLFVLKLKELIALDKEEFDAVSSYNAL